MRLIDVDELYRIIKLVWETSDEEDFEKGVFAAIENAPTIKPKKGKWLTNEEIVRPTRFIEWHCSRCGYVFESMDSPGYKFCPGCGSYNGGDEA